MKVIWPRLGKGRCGPSSKMALRACALVAALLLVGTLAGAQEPEDLTLRINDTDALPGGLAAISVRTYASRPMSQGQLCFRSTRRSARGATNGPLESIEDFVVFSTGNDATANVSLLADGVGVVIDFSSLSATVNAADGPLLAIFVRLRSDLVAGETFELALDLAETQVFDASGEPISLRPRAGDLTVRTALDPLVVSADGEEALPGGSALLSIQTSQILPWSSAHFDFNYPVGLAAGPPSVWVDPRFGNAQVTAQETTPGVLEIDVTSQDTSLNELPGDLIQISFPVRLDAVPGSVWPVSLDKGTAQVLDAASSPIALTLEDGLLEVSLGEVFADGFESGTTNEWFLTSP